MKVQQELLPLYVYIGYNYWRGHFGLIYMAAVWTALARGATGCMGLQGHDVENFHAFLSF